MLILSFFQNCDSVFDGNGLLSVFAEKILERKRAVLHLVRADHGCVREARSACVFHFLFHALFAVVNVGGDASRAEAVRNGNGVGNGVLVHRDHEHVCHRALLGGDESVIAKLREKTGKTDGDADAGELFVGVIAGEVIVAAAGANAAEFGVSVDGSLVNGAGVVVETSCNGKVELKVFFGHTERDHSIGDGFELVHTRVENFVFDAERAELFEHLFSGAVDGDEADDIFCLFSGNTDRNKLFDDRILADLFDLVDHAEDLFDLIGKTLRGEETAEDLSVVDADGEITDAELFENVIDDDGHFRIVKDGKLFVADDIDITLIEFAEAALLGTFAAVYLAHVVTLEGENEVVVVRRNVTCERNGQVETKGKIVVALVETVDLLFGLAACFCEEDLGKLDGRRIDRKEAEAFVYAADRIVHIVEKNLVGGEKLHKAGQDSGGNFILHSISP